MDFKETDVRDVIERVIDYEYKKLKTKDMKKEDLIKKHLEGWSGLRKSSIDNFAESGRVSGGFLIAINEMLDEHVRQQNTDAINHINTIASLLYRYDITESQAETVERILNLYLKSE